jgi:hypothetical protein
MNQKNYLTLDKEFLSYCELNNIDNIEKFAKEVFNRGFNIIKYGETPMGFSNEKIVIKEVSVEKIVEVIKEVPVEIKSEPQIVVKEIQVTNNEEVDKLIDENNKLREENLKINSVLEIFTKKGKIIRDSNLNSLYDE